MKCKKCGNEIEKGNKFCENCGNDLKFNLFQEDLTQKYLVKQVTLKEKLIGTGSNSVTLSLLQKEINKYADLGYKLHTISTASANSTGWIGGDRIQATMVFEKI